LIRPGVGLGNECVEGYKCFIDSSL